MYQTDKDIFMTWQECINDMYVAVHNEIEDVKEEIEEEIIPLIEETIQPQLDDLQENKFGYAEYSDEEGEDQYFLKLYNTDPELGGEELQRVKIVGGGGGGGGGGAKLTVTNTTGWLTKKVSKTTEHLYLTFTWSSIEEQQPTGAGVIQATVNNVSKVSKSIQQGNVSLDIMPHLYDGDNSVSITISDTYNNKRTIKFRIEVANLSIYSTYDESVAQTGAIDFVYVPSGTGLKTVYFKIDGSTIATTTTSVSDVQLTQIIPMQQHGAHILEVYFTIDISGEAVYSNTLRYNLISVSGTSVIIASTYNTNTVEQYTTVEVPFYAYDPQHATTTVQLYYDSTLVGSQTVDRQQQTFQYRFNAIGSHTLKILHDSGVQKVFSFTITQSTVDVYVETEARDLYLTAQGRSNSEPAETRSTWSDTTAGVSCTLTGFNFITNGWFSNAQDSRIKSGETVLRVGGTSSLTIPIYPFGPTFQKTQGKTIEFRVAARDVFDYDQVIISCWQGATGQERGIKLTSKDLYFASSSAKIHSKHKDEEYFTVSFVINKSSNLDRVIYAYVDGVLCGATEYSTTEDFQQLSPVTISINGNNKVVVDIGRVRIYHNNLNRNQVLNNVIADTGNTDDMVTMYQHNNILNSSREITIETLPADLPYLIIEGTLPVTKEGSTRVNVTYVDPVTPSKSYTSSNVKCSVQGTSSAG